MVRKARSHNKVQPVSSQDTQNDYSAQDIADTFLSQYYNFLCDFPEEMHKFYKEESTLTIPVEDGSIRSVTTIKEIRKVILESDIRNRDIIRLNVHAQDSIANSIVIGVVGVLRKDSTVKRFSQTFLLAPQPRGFYVHTDFFQFLITNDDTAEDNPVLMKDQGTSTEDDKITVDSSNNMSSLVLSDERSDTKKDVKKKSYASIITKACSFSIPKATVEVSQKTNGKSSAPLKNEKDIATEAAREILEMDKSCKSSSTDEVIDTENGQAEKNSSLDTQDEFEEKKSYATNDGHRYAFMEFNAQKAAKQVVEAGYIQLDGYECEVEYKKGQEGYDRNTGSSRDSVGDNKSGDNNGNGNVEKVPSTSVDPISSSWARLVLTNVRLEVEVFYGTYHFGMWQTEVLYALFQQGLDIAVEGSKPEDVEQRIWLTINQLACATGVKAKLN
ncbi:Nuclear transport factor 2 [Artemisia annua]|uniref:Nuclear transport factor 2 n=1 Tax=Artemisia annua TaxID=35608 RepID=A0A2U1QKY3_ARTAN|nr:Nuclear transport factor 2 [Artemisia annua]